MGRSVCGYLQLLTTTAARTISTPSDSLRGAKKEGKEASKEGKEGGVGVAVGDDGLREKAPKDAGEARGITSDANIEDSEGDGTGDTEEDTDGT